MTAEKKRVLVVDDSVFARKIISDIIGSSPELTVAGAAASGKEALPLVERLRPDVITLDIEMPGIDGIETLRRIMQERPTPVLMLSSLTSRGAKESIVALRLGAVDVMAKPHGSHSIGLTALRDELIAKVLAASRVDVSHLGPVAAPRQRAASPPRARTAAVRPSAYPVVIVASSTGGPRALRMLVPGLTSQAGAAYVIVQHLPEGFSGPLAVDLDACTDLRVREASDGDSLHPGDVLLARAGYHLTFADAATVRLAKTPPLWGVRPSADVTMVSAVPILGSRLIAVVLTGMGRDGADGLRLIKQAGGVTLAEHESSCVVYGMPRTAAETGAVDVVAPIEAMAEAVNSAVIKVARLGHRRLTVA